MTHTSEGNRRRKWLLMVAAATVIAAVAWFPLHCYFMYLDETLVQGSAYGFDIGMSKEDSFRAAKQHYRGNEIVFPSFAAVGTPDPRQSRELTDHASMDDIYSQRDVWNVDMLSPSPDFVRLRFKDARLIEIHRHRNRCDL